MSISNSARRFTAPKRRVERIFLHCSASDDPALVGPVLVDEVRKWHRARGFRDVGYHFLIDKAGKRLRGRDLELTPAAQKRHNVHTIAIMVHGLKEFPNASLDAVERLCAEINAAYRGMITFHGHCEVSDRACPVFDYRTELALDKWNRMPA